jgi:hypothetical protein
MKTRPIHRVMWVSAISLTLFLMVVALFFATRSASLALVDESAPATQSSAPRSPGAVARVLLPKSTAAYNGISEPATKVYAPWVLGGTSVLRVLNTGNAATQVQISYGAAGEGTSIQLPAGAAGEVRATGVPTGTRAAAILSADQALAVEVHDFGVDRTRAVSYVGLPAALGKSFLVLPDVLRRASGWESQIVIQNVGTVSTSLTVVFSRTDEPAFRNWVDTSMQDLEPEESYEIDLSQVGLPEGFEGIATVTSEQPVIAVVHNGTPRHAYAYQFPMPGEGQGSGRSLYFPMLVNTFEDWQISQIQVVNAAPQPRSFNIQVGDDNSQQSIDPWWAQSYPQGPVPDPLAIPILSPSGEIVGGTVQDAQSLYSLVWLNGIGGFIGDSFASYSSPGTGGLTWYLPYADQEVVLATYVAIQNVSGQTANLTITRHTFSGTLTTSPGQIGPSEVAVLSKGEGLPSSFVGGLTVEADHPVIAVAVIAGRLELAQEIFMPVLTRNYPVAGEGG